MKVAPVDQRHVDRNTSEILRDVQSAEPSANHNDAMHGGSILCWWRHHGVVNPLRPSSPRL
jgi:hypothetical protein